MASESILSKLADEVAAAINGETWDETLQACTKFKPVKRREDLGASMLVEVVPRKQMRKRIARGTAPGGLWQKQYVVVVGITKAIDENDSDKQTDHCNAIADEIATVLQDAAYTNGYLESIDEEPTYHPQRLDQDGVFTRALVLQFGGRAVYGC